MTGVPGDATDGRRAARGRPWTNWAGNQRAIAASVVRPDGRDQVAEVVKAAAAKGTSVKVVGGGHSFAAVAATFGVRVELPGNGPILVDRELGTVTAPAGTRLPRLSAVLAEHGLALPGIGQHGLTLARRQHHGAGGNRAGSNGAGSNGAGGDRAGGDGAPAAGTASAEAATSASGCSATAPTLAGALATGGHGTGSRAGGLAASVTALELVTATGRVLRCSATEQSDVFAAALVGLGAVGIVTEVTLRCVPAFTLLVDERTADLDEVLTGAEGHLAGNDHVWYSWFPYTGTVRVRLANRVPADDRPLPAWRHWFEESLMADAGYRIACRAGRRWPALAGGVARYAARHPAARGHTAPWYTAFTDPRRVRHVAMEYAVPRPAMPELLASVRSIVDHLPEAVFLPVEVRFGAADDAWLSPAYRRDTAYVTVRQYHGMPYEEYFLRIEALAAALGGRPHWGMVHWRDAASLAVAYPRFGDFLAVRDRLDPDRLFGNAYLERVLGP